MPCFQYWCPLSLPSASPFVFLSLYPSSDFFFHLSVSQGHRLGHRLQFRPSLQPQWHRHEGPVPAMCGLSFSADSYKWTGSTLGSHYTSRCSVYSVTDPSPRKWPTTISTPWPSPMLLAAWNPSNEGKKEGGNSDVNYPYLGWTSQVKGTVLSQNAISSETRHMSGFTRDTLTLTNW